MLHPATELRRVDPTIGYGVFATAFIPAGTLTWVLDSLDQLITPERMSAMDGRAVALVEKYTWLVPTGQRILCWDFGRFMNHSCAPNCVTAGVDFEVAVRDIEVGEELTNDYATLSLERAFTCRCRASHCRRRVYPEDIEQVADRYDRQLADAMRRASSVPQPLLSWMRDRHALNRVLRGESLPSILDRHVSPIGVLAMAARGGAE